MGADDGVIGQVVGGRFGDVIIRQKAGTTLEIGSLLVSDEGNGFVILQVFALEYASQIQDRIQQMRSSINLEQGVEARFYEPEFVNYVLARMKQMARISSSDQVSIPKSLPTFFNKLRPISKDDLGFLQKREGDIFVGHIRSGTKVIEDAGVWLPAEDVFAHHILIPAATGRGKSNLVKTILYHTMDSNRVGALVLDAHDEYYGRHGPGLKDHPDARDNLEYYTAEDPPPGANMLAINLQSIRPEHFEGIVELSEAQERAMRMLYMKYRKGWISALMLTDPSAAEDETAASTRAVLKRKVQLVLGLDVDDEGNLISAHNVFDSGTKGFKTVDQVVQHIEQGRVVVLDTSRLGDEAELIVGNIIAARLLRRYKLHKARGQLADKPVATIVIEEAPRVIGEDVLASNGNIYATIAKEGRKFKIGLTAITQLSSVIPKTILANMNTKIVLGNEMRQERAAIIASSSQDLSDDDRNIASLDKGEAIVTSIFVPFAMPVKIPLFEDLIKGRAPRRQKTMRVP